jgi:hypothetical protein
MSDDAVLQQLIVIGRVRRATHSVDVLAVCDIAERANVSTAPRR